MKFDEIGAENKLLGTQVEFISIEINHCVQGGRGGVGEISSKYHMMFWCNNPKKFDRVRKSQIVRNI